MITIYNCRTSARSDVMEPVMVHAGQSPIAHAGAAELVGAA